MLYRKGITGTGIDEPCHGLDKAIWQPLVAKLEPLTNMEDV